MVLQACGSSATSRPSSAARSHNAPNPSVAEGRRPPVSAPTAGERADRDGQRERQLLASEPVGVAPVGRIVPPEQRLDLDQSDPVVGEQRPEVGVGPTLGPQPRVLADVQPQPVEAGPGDGGDPLPKAGTTQAAVCEDELGDRRPHALRRGRAHRATTARLPSRQR